MYLLESLFLKTPSQGFSAKIHAARPVQSIRGTRWVILCVHCERNEHGGFAKFWLSADHHSMKVQHASANLHTRLPLLGHNWKQLDDGAVPSASRVYDTCSHLQSHRHQKNWKQLDAVGFMNTCWPGSWQQLYENTFVFSSFPDPCCKSAPQVTIDRACVRTVVVSGFVLVVVCPSSLALTQISHQARKGQCMASWD